MLALELNSDTLEACQSAIIGGGNPILDPFRQIDTPNRVRLISLRMNVQSKCMICSVCLFV